MTTTLENRIENKYKSKGETKIAKLLKQYGIRFEYEPDIFLKEENKRYLWHPDFYLPEHQTIIEYFGIKNNQNYNTGIRKKKKIYHKNHYHLIPVYPKTLKKNYQTYILKNLHNYQKNKLTDLQRKIGNKFYK